MNTTQITDSLSHLFHTEGHRIVFWHDPDQEFVDLVPELNLDGVRLIHLDQESKLELKVRLELEDQNGKYLLYSSAPEPDSDNDWLLDIRLYSRNFFTDLASTLLSELGLNNQSMREHLNLRKKFFRSRERTERLKKIVSAEDREDELDLKILAVLTRSEQPGIFDILMKLFSEMCADNEADFKATPPSWREIVNFGMDAFFWEKIARDFGYSKKDQRLSDLLIHILVSDFANNLKGDPPESVRHFLLQNGVGSNISVFAAQWRSHLGYFKQYIALSSAVAEELALEEKLGSYDEKSLMDVMTFELAERQIIRCLRTRMIREGADNADELKETLMRRKDGYWCTVNLDEHGHTSNIYLNIYEALEAVLELLKLRQAYGSGFTFPSAEKMYKAYTGELFRFDQLYRHFHEAADIAELAGWDILKEIHSLVESCYSNWFLDNLAACWGGFIQTEDGLLANWNIRDVHRQQHFFNNWIKPVLKSHPRHKVFVIISDALRFETAEELCRELNSKSRFKAKLNSQLGVLPSYTALGMAALLPGREYGYREGSDEILVDGKSCATLQQRSEILSAHEGVAVRGTDMLAMNKEQGRELIRPWRAVYIYHNQIDATGDKADTETKTFSAARKAINELSSMVRFIVNSLNGTNVLITADHGFVYQDTLPTDLEKSCLEHKPSGVIKAKKRYILGKNLGDSDKVWHGTTARTADTKDDMEFWIPRGINRFHFTGGARFVHGGAMPQEIVVPVIQVKELDTKKARKNAVKKVGVSLLGSNRKVVNTMNKFEFIQTEKVSERTLPRTLNVSLRDGDELISDEQTVTFESRSESMEERKQAVKIVLKKGQYDSSREYSLVLRDPETRIEYERIPITIDLAFFDDF